MFGTMSLSSPSNYSWGRRRSLSSMQLKERDDALRPLNQRYNLAKVKRDKVMMRDLEKQIKAIQDRYSMIEYW